jgi:hypothetical protein
MTMSPDFSVRRRAHADGDPFAQMLYGTFELPTGVLPHRPAGQEWAKLRWPDTENSVRLRLAEFAAALGEREYLEPRGPTSRRQAIATSRSATRSSSAVELQPAATDSPPTPLPSSRSRRYGCGSALKSTP